MTTPSGTAGPAPTLEALLRSQSVPFLLGPLQSRGFQTPASLGQLQSSDVSPLLQAQTGITQTRGRAFLEAALFWAQRGLGSDTPVLLAHGLRNAAPFSTQRDLLASIPISEEGRARITALIASPQQQQQQQSSSTSSTNTGSSNTPPSAAPRKLLASRGASLKLLPKQSESAAAASASSSNPSSQSPSTSGASLTRQPSGSGSGSSANLHAGSAHGSPAGSKPASLTREASLDNVIQPGDEAPLVSKRRPVILQRSNTTPPEELMGIVTKSAAASRTADKQPQEKGSEHLTSIPESSSVAAVATTTSGDAADSRPSKPALRRTVSEPIHQIHEGKVTKVDSTDTQAQPQAQPQTQTQPQPQAEAEPQASASTASTSASASTASASSSNPQQAAAAIMQRIAANREALANAEPLPIKSLETAVTRAQVTKAGHGSGASRKPLHAVKTIPPVDSAALLADLLRTSTEDVRRDLTYRRDQSRAAALEHQGPSAVETFWVWVHVTQHQNCYIRPYLASSYQDMNYYDSSFLAMEVPDVPNLYAFAIRTSDWETQKEHGISVMLVDELTNYLLLSTYSGITRNQTSLFVTLNAPESGVSDADNKTAAKHAFTMGISLHVANRIRFPTQSTTISPVTRIPQMTVQQYMPCFDKLKSSDLSPQPTTLGEVLSIFIELHKTPAFCEYITCWLLLIYNHRYFGQNSVIPVRAMDHATTIVFTPYIQSLERALRMRQGLMAPLRIIMTSLFYLLTDIIYRSNDDFVYPICFFNSLFNQLPNIQLRDIEKIECKYDEAQSIRSPEVFRDIATSFFTILRRPDSQHYIFRPFSLGEYVSKLLSLEDRAAVLKKVVEELQIEKFRSRLDPTESSAMIYFRMRDDLVDGINRTLLKEFKLEDLRRLISLLKDGYWSLISIDACQSILEGLTNDEQYLKAIFDLLQRDRHLINDRITQHLLWNGLVCRWPDVLKWMDLLFYTRYFRDYKKLLEESFLRSFKARDKEIYEDFKKHILSMKEFYSLFSQVDARKAFENAFVSFLALSRVEKVTKCLFEATNEFSQLPETMRDAILGHLSNQFCTDPKLDSILFLIKLDDITNVIVDRLMFDLVQAIRLPREFPSFLKEHNYWHSLYVKLRESKEKLHSKLKTANTALHYLVTSFQKSVEDKSALFSLLEDTHPYLEQIDVTFGATFLEQYKALYDEMQKMALIFRQLKEFNQHFIFSLGNSKVYETLETIYTSIERAWGGLNIESSTKRLPCTLR